MMQRAGEVADHSDHVDSGKLGTDLLRRAFQCRHRNILRYIRSQSSTSGHRVEEQPGLLRGTGTQFDQDLGFGQRSDLVGVLREQAALGTGGVILG